MNAIKYAKNESGMALITVMIILVAIAIISGALIFSATTQYRISRRNKAENYRNFRNRHPSRPSLAIPGAR